MLAVEVKSDKIKISAGGRTMSLPGDVDTMEKGLPIMLHRVEHFDEEILRAMLMDERFPKSERDRLGLYYRNRAGPSESRIKYVLGKNHADANLGRLFPEDGLGLANVRRDIRSPLLSKKYWDTDFENCHYNIALTFCIKYGLKHENISKYIENREESLKMVSPIRYRAKIEFLKVAYGGDVSLYDSTITDDTITITSEGAAFLSAIKSEFNFLAESIWSNHAEFHKIKGGAEKLPFNKRPNGKHALMSCIFQREERRCLMVWEAFLSSVGRYLGVLIHDGGCVEKLEGELSFPEELLRAGEEAIKKNTPYDLTITVKPMEHSYVPPTCVGDGYERMKRDFEKKNFLIGATLNCICEDGTRLEMDWAKAKIKFANWTYPEMSIHPKTGEMMMKKTPFLPKWLEDSERRDYERCDFVPNREMCPKSVFNLFHGFEAEKLPEIDAKEIDDLIKPILYHINTLTGGYAEYVVKWFANILQTPDKKSDVAILIRDMGGLLFEGGGTGKNLFMDWFGNKILGSDYYLVVGDNSILYGAFNSTFEGKLLCMIEEANGKDNHSNNDRLKSKITAKKTVVNKKCIAQYEVNDYMRIAACSNNINSIPVRNGDRRFTVYDTDPKHRNEKAYFDALAEAMDSPKVQRAFFQYLMTTETYKTPIQFQINRPITPAYVHVRNINAPIHYKWLCAELRKGTLPTEGTSREMFVQFTKWVESTRERSSEGTVTETAFGKLMNEVMEDGSDPLTDVRKSYGIMVRSFNVKKLVEGLEKLHLLNVGEITLTPEGCLIPLDPAAE